MVTEKFLQRLIISSESNVPRGSGITDAISVAVLGETALLVFDSLYNLMFDSEAHNNHVFALIKCVSFCYVKVRLNHIAKSAANQATGKRVRKTLGKMILFKNQ